VDAVQVLDDLIARGERVVLRLAAQPVTGLAQLAAEARLLCGGEIARLDTLHFA
jgi:hypothetical protein